jgi:hypothetical protein
VPVRPRVPVPVKKNRDNLGYRYRFFIKKNQDNLGYRYRFKKNRDNLGYRYRFYIKKTKTISDTDTGLKKTGTISDTGTGFLKKQEQSRIPEPGFLKKTGTIRETKARIRLWYYISSSADPAHNR